MTIPARRDTLEKQRRTFLAHFDRALLPRVDKDKNVISSYPEDDEERHQIQDPHSAKVHRSLCKKVSQRKADEDVEHACSESTRLSEEGLRGRVTDSKQASKQARPLASPPTKHAQEEGLDMEDDIDLNGNDADNNQGGVFNHQVPKIIGRLSTRERA